MKAIFSKLVGKGIRFSDEDGQLKVQLGAAKLTDDEKQQVVANKSALLEYLGDSKVSLLSFAQERMWFVSQLGTSSQYHLGGFIRIKGSFDQEVFQKALHYMSRRHEGFRTGFSMLEGNVVQQIRRHLTIPFDLQDIAYEGSAAQEALLPDIKRAFLEASFDLAQPPLIRVKVVKQQEDQFLLGVCMHHIISDGWSLKIFVSELWNAYDQYLSGLEPQLPALKLQYDDYAIWVKQNFSGRKLQNEIQYWKNELEGFENLELPTDFPRLEQSTGHGKTLKLQISAPQIARFTQMGETKGFSLYVYVVTAVYMLLHKYSGQSQFCIGMPVSNRNDVAIEGIIGFFVNNLTIRLKEADRKGLTVLELLQMVQQKIVTGQDHQKIPFERIVEEVAVQRDQSRNPVFQVMVNSINGMTENDHTPDSFTFELEEVENNAAKFDLTFSLDQLADEAGYELKLVYSNDLFTKESAERMLRHLHLILTAIPDELKTPFAAVQLLDEGEESQLLALGHSPVKVDKNGLLHEFMEAFATQNPDHKAIFYKDEVLTYGELDAKAHQLALVLQQKGVGPDSLVAVCMKSSAELMVSLFAILKAGGAYVPVDSDYPQDRIQYIIEDCEYKVLITNQKSLNCIPELSDTGKLLNLTEQSASIAQMEGQLVREVAESNLAYVIYTSGSTGKPKGVKISHWNVMRMISLTYIDLKPSDRVMHLSNFAFDGSVFDLFTSLCNGAQLAIVDKGDDFSVQQAVNFIKDKEITVSFMTTALLNAVVDTAPEVLQSLRKVLFGGEKASVKHVNQAVELLGEGRLLHFYGPTETTVYATWYTVKQRKYEGAIPIGKPFTDTDLYVLDEHLKLQPKGLAGELYVSGRGVSSGYLNRPELTAERFIDNPFQPGSKMYKTGDIVRWNAEGDLEFIRRADDQVKVRGYRIELGEIENAINALAGLASSAVITRELKGVQQLVAFYTGEEIPHDELRKQLSGELPAFMIPAGFQRLDKLPITANGKTNKRLLGTYEVAMADQRNYVAPETATEKEVVRIWAAILEVDQVGVTDNFFELGGHSLLITNLINEIQTQFGVRLQLKDIFKKPVPEHIAALIDQSADGAQQEDLLIKQRADVDHFPLSFSQERLWFLDQMGLGHQYHIPAVFELKGSYDSQLIKASFEYLVRRHESFRTTFGLIDGVPCQQVLEEVHFDWEVRDLSKETDHKDQCDELIRAFVNRPFNLATGPLLRTMLIELDNGRAVFAVNMHHIISDGWSSGILTRELATVYQQLLDGQQPSLPALPIQYKDYADWQRDFLSGDRLEEAISHWKTHLEGYEDLILPTDFARPAELSGEGRSVYQKLAPEIHQQLSEFSKSRGISDFAVLLSGVYTILHAYSRQESINVGIPMANRDQQNVGDLVGFFINTVVNRIAIDGQQTFGTLVAAVAAELIRGQENQQVPFEKIVEAINPGRDQSRNPLFQVMVNYLNFSEKEFQLPDFSMNPLESGYHQTKFDLEFRFSEMKDGELLLGLDYSVDLFRKDTMERLLAQFQTLLGQLLNAPEQAIQQLNLLSGEEEKQLLHAVNQTDAPYPSGQCVHELFEAMAVRQPEQIAIRHRSVTLNYGEVNDRANQLAAMLVQEGVKAGDFVGICMDRSADFILSVLAILKAGGAYVPMGIENPDERISYMISDSAVRVILTDTDQQERIGSMGFEGKVLCFDGDLNERLSTGNLSFTKPEVTPDHLIYVIYTSGSTGKPKGVKLAHKGLVNYLTDVQRGYQLKNIESNLRHFAFFGNVSFDATATTFLTPLISGGTCHVYDAAYSNQEVMKLILEHEEIDVIKLTPSHMQLILETDIQPVDASKLLIVGGEALKTSLVQSVLDKGLSVQVINEYGPTECSVAATIHLYEQGFRYNNVVHIGKPLANTQVYILDAAGKPLPSGIPGELYLGGAGLAQGYHNRPDLTAERFIPHPLASDQKVYKTGDLVRWIADGNIEFIGRVDEQVKIRGYRIELGEVEAAMMENEAIRQAAVIVKEQAGNPMLIGFFTAADEVAPQAIKDFLKMKLPEFMVPVGFSQVDEMPLTANGKVNKRHLHTIQVTLADEKQYIAPRTATEQQLVAIWEELLGVEQVGVADNFFELGGHSLLITRLINAISERFGVTIQLKDIFQQPVVEHVALLIEQQESAGIDVSLRIEKAINVDRYPLSFSQERLWFIDQMGLGYQYHIPIVYEIQGDYNPHLIKASFDFLVERHESFRTVFSTENGTPYQQIVADQGFEWMAHDLSGETEITQKQAGLIREFAGKSFSLSDGPLLRVMMIKLADQKAIFGVNMHHIISDGWSSGVLTKEFVTVYEQLSAGLSPQLEPLPIQYKDYAYWQRAYLNDTRLKASLAHWQNHLEGYEDLAMPTDFQRPAELSGKGGSVRRKLSTRINQQLLAFSKSRGMSSFVVLLSGAYGILHYYTRQESINIGIPMANRNQHNISGLVGFFVNTVVNRIQLNDEQTFDQLLDAVAEELIRSQENQLIPFERIVEAVNPDRDPSRTPLFQVLVNYLNFSENESSVPGMTLKALSNDYHQSKFDLTFNFLEQRDGSLMIGLDYSADLFKESTIEQILAQYELLLTQILAAPEKKVVQASLLSEDDRQKLLIEANQTEVPFADDKCVHQLFEEFAVSDPDRVFINYQEQSMTYGEVNRYADQLACQLIAGGIEKGHLIGVFMDRSPGFLISVLAIMKAGAAYVPMGIENPDDRIQYIIEDTETPLIITDEERANRVGQMTFDGQLLIFNEALMEQLATSTETLQKPAYSSMDLLYVIYTSGSTGKPKGARLRHKGVVNFVLHVGRHYKLPNIESGISHFAFFGNVSFDGTLITFIGPMITGGTSYVYDSSLSNQELIKTTLEHEEINVIKLTPAHLQLIRETEIEVVDLPKLLIVGGEALKKRDVDLVLDKGLNIQVMNQYGPTETSVAMTFHLYDPTYDYNNVVYIGRPFANVEVFIMDKEGRPLPAGIPGELYIGGVGLAEGYHNRPDLTAEKFIEHPFDPQQKVYKSGDMVRWTPDGYIEFLGRADEQVKIRGYRIELGEIESVMTQHEAVEQAAVIVKEQKNSQLLVGFYTSPQSVDAAAVKDFLKTKLPDFMVPTAVQCIDEIPLTPNAKVNKRLLGTYEIAMNDQQQYMAPQTDTEKQLVGIWESLLEVEKIGVQDNFFELGGHSLLITRLVNAIQEQFEVHLHLKEIFRDPVVAYVARLIDQRAASEENASYNIVPITSVEQFPLSFSQERLWFLDQMGMGNQYHIPAVFELEGAYELEAIRATFQYLVERHESFRTVFKVADETPYQQVLESQQFDWITHDGLLGDDEARKGEIIRNFVERPFVLSEGPLLRVLFIELADQRALFGINMHHIISDGWSSGIITSEFVTVYKQILAGQQPMLKALPVQYKDYAYWQRDFLSGDRLEEAIAHWTAHLEGYEDLALPTDFQRPAKLSGKGAIVQRKIDQTINQQLSEFSKTRGVSSFSVLLTGVFTILHYYSRQYSINVGIPMANRNQQKIAGLVGFFVNTVINRIQLKTEQTFEELVTAVNEELIRSQENQLIPFERIVEAVNPERDQSRNPLFQVLVNYANFTERDLNIPGISLKPLQSSYQQSKVDLGFNFAEQKDGSLMFSVDYSTDLFRENSIDQLVDQFEILLAQILFSPEKALHQVSLLSEQEERHLLYEVNQTEVPFESSRCVHELFEAHAAQNPDKAAIVYQDQTLTYAEVDHRATQLAVMLMQEGVGVGDLVGICMDRSPDLVISAFAILKAGAAYVPIGIENPDERIQYMIEDSNARVLITDAERYDRAVEMTFEGKLLRFDNELRAHIANANEVLQQPEVTPEDLVYVIYTSGSTGKPKGAMLKHIGLVNYLTEIQNGYRIESIGSHYHNFAFFGNVSFDSTNSTFLTPLVSGGACHIYDASHSTQEVLKTIFEHEAINAIKLTPSHLQLVLETDIKPVAHWKLLVVGGEALKTSLVHATLAKGLKLKITNEYGPTECSIATTVSHFEPDFDYNNFVHIGKPFANTQVYIVDADGKPLPRGIAGELYLGGTALGRGYHNRPDLTAEKFIDHPFESGKKVYKTGDLVRWIEEDNIEFIGRIDHQVKVRGYRIELGEIESVMVQQDALEQAVVIVKEQAGDKLLVGFYTADSTLAPQEVKAFLSARLPDYMVPAVVEQIDTIPLTPNGKANKMLLQSRPVNIVSDQEYVAPRNETEERLTAIWQELLNREQVGINDNFFELGGHSLLATKVISRINKVFAINLSVGVIFKASTLAALATEVTDAGESAEKSLQAYDRPEDIPLSFTQERLWFLDELGQGDQYHIASVFNVTGRVRLDILQQSIDLLVQRHESLRTYFVSRDGIPYQKVDDARRIAVKYIRLTGLDAEKQAHETTEAVNRLSKAPFDFEQGPMIRVLLIEKSEEDFVMGLCMHHIVSDGWSNNVLTQELTWFYGQLLRNEDPTLPALPVQYVDYALWQRSVMTPEKLERDLAHWTNHLAGHQDLEMPTDFPRPEVKLGNGAISYIMFEEELASQVKAFAKDQSVTVFNTLAAAVYALLYAHSGQQDITIGMPIANRDQSDLEGLIGFFANTVVFRLLLDPEDQVTDMVNKVKSELIRTQNYQRFPFDRLVAALKPERELNRTPLFQVLINYMVKEEQTLVIDENLKLEAYDKEHDIAKFDLHFAFMEDHTGRLALSVEYSTELYKEETILKLQHHLVRILEQMTARPKLQLQDFEILSEAEKQAQLPVIEETYNARTGQTIQQRIDEMCAERGDAVAIREGDHSISYNELKYRSDRLAAQFVNLGIEKGDGIAICMEPGIDNVLAMIAAMKAGGCFVQITPQMPAERQHFMLLDTRTRLLVTHSGQSVGKAEVHGLTRFQMDTWQAEDGTGATMAETRFDECSEAYMVYVPGLSGQPEAILYSHQAISNAIDRLSQTSSDQSREPVQCTQFAAMDTTDAIQELFHALTNGDTLTIVPEHVKRDPAELISLLIGHEIERVQLPVAYLPHFCRMANELGSILPRLKVLTVIGTHLEINEEVSRFFSKNQQMVLEHQFTTPATHLVSTRTVPLADIQAQGDEAARIPIGGTAACLLNPGLQMMPIGSVGELFVVSTASRNERGKAQSGGVLIDNPFGLGQLYRTGILARWSRSGTLQYVGQTDRQLNTRGFEVATAEIEAAMSSYPNVQRIAVVVRKIHDRSRMVAFYEASAFIDAADWISWLGQKLPAHMIPSVFEKVDAMPLRANQLPDITKLKLSAISPSGNNQHEAPANVTEKKLSSIWSTLLHHEQFGVNDDFLTIGGDSLLLMQLTVMIQQEFNITLKVSDLMENLTIKKCAQYISQAKKSNNANSLSNFMQNENELSY